ncbi:MAG: LamG domain-containing protein, partial [Candidatus Thorarchaeota archaeon]
HHDYSGLTANDSIAADALFVEDYSCNETGYLTNTERDYGKHALLFDFGGQEAIATNDVNNLSVAFNVTLNSTYGTNFSDENLTVYWNVSDLDGDNITNVTNWYLNGTSIAILNMPFENWGSNSTHNASNLTLDYSNFSNHAAFINATWNATGGYDGWGAYEFDGANCIKTSQDFMSKPSAISVEGRFKSTSSASTMLFAVEGAYVLYINNDDVGELLPIFDGTGAGDVGFGSGYNDGNWHHFVASNNGTNTTLYVDGSYVNSKLETLYNLSLVNRNSTIGSQHDCAQRFFDGTIDDFRIYVNRTLSAEQVKALYENMTDTIVSHETSVGDVWQACVTPNDGIEDGTVNCSNTLSVLNEPPEASNVVLNSTSGTNYSNENLTVYWDVSDDDGDDVANITNWYLNGTSIAVLNVPFEATGGNESSWTRDYSNNSYHGSVSNAAWNATGGYDGFGAYEFDGSSAYIDQGSISPVGSSDFSISGWIKKPNENAKQKVVDFRTGASGAGFFIHIQDNAETADGALRFLINDNVDTVNVYGTDVIDDGKWHHFAIIVERDVNATIYIDGTEDATADVSSTVGDLGAHPFYIGTATSNVQYFNGALDEFKVFNRKLSEEQVLALYNNRTDLLVSQETAIGDVWSSCIVPNDGTEDGLENCSNTLTVVEIPNFVPVAYNVTLNSSSGTNYSDENLTVYWDVSDANGDNVTNITNWYLNGASITVLNMPFEKWGSNSTHNVSNLTLDYSNFSNDGTMTGSSNATWNAAGGYDGFGAYEFDGIDDYILVADTPSVSPTSEISIEAWVKPNSFTNAHFISKWKEGAATFGTFIVTFNDSGNPRFLLSSDGGVGAPSIASPDTVSLNTWHHIVATAKGNDYMRLYVNGELKVTNDTIDFNPYDSDSIITIGARPSGSRYFNGTVDQVRIYNRTLSAEQVLALYNNRTDLLVSQETAIGDVWSSCIVPNDGTEDGLENCSNTLTVLNKPPEVSNVVLNSTSGTNYTSENLTVYWDTVDFDGDDVHNVTNWYLNGTSITVLNMPFEKWGANATHNVSNLTLDYSNYSYDGNVSGAVWNAAGGYDGWGAYEFDGSHYIVTSSTGTIGQAPLTATAWIKTANATGHFYSERGD